MCCAKLAPNPPSSGNTQIPKPLVSTNVKLVIPNYSDRLKNFTQDAAGLRFISPARARQLLKSRISRLAWCVQRCGVQIATHTLATCFKVKALILPLICVIASTRYRSHSFLACRNCKYANHGANNAYVLRRQQAFFQYLPGQNDCDNGK